MQRAKNFKLTCSLVEEVNKQNSDVVKKLEDFKVKVRKFSINFSKKHQWNLKSKINFIETQFNKIDELDLNVIDMNKKRALEAELCELYSLEYSYVTIKANVMTETGQIQ